MSRIRHIARWPRAAVALAVVLAGVAGPAPVPAAAAGPQPNAAWAQFKGDAQKTGRSPLVGPTAPEVKWTFAAGSPITSGPVIDADGTVYIGTENSRIYAVDATGKQKWMYQIEGGNGAPTYPLLTSRGQIVFGAGGGFVQGLKLEDGKEVWKFDLTGAPYSAGREPIRGAPALSPNYANILIGTDNASVYELEEGGGYVSVRRGDAGPVRSGAAITPDGTVVWASGDPALLGGLAQGGNKWSVGSDGQLSTPVVAADSVTFAFSEGGSVFAILTDGRPKYGYDDSQVKDPIKDIEKRKPIWSKKVGGRFRGSPALGVDGTLYAGADDGKLYAVESETGQARWSYGTGAAITGAPTIGANGLIYFGSIDSHLYVLTPDGKEVASFRTDGAIDRSSPAIARDGTLYIGTRIGTLYAFKDGKPGTVFSPPLTPTPGPATATAIPTYGKGTPSPTPGPILPTATPRPSSTPQPTTPPTPAVQVASTGLPTDRATAGPEGRYFAETGHNLKSPFLDFFDTWGGVDVLGYPRTEEMFVDTRRVQYFQRVRLEYHPDQAGTAQAVQVSLLGDALTADRRPFPTATPVEGAADLRYFPEVRHTVKGPFLRAFESRGGLTVLGYPISEELQESNGDGSGQTYTMQYFQRARLEYHPEAAGTPNEVQLGLLGDQALRDRGWLP